MTLKRRLADAGFESNDDFEFPLRVLFEAQVAHLRCLHVDGEPGRRKTAFANALAQALDYPHVVYHDFSRAEPPPAPIVIAGPIEDAAPEPVEAPMSGFERALTEACAYSEAARTIAILDQIQAADFRDQLRLAGFIATHEWPAAQGSVRANPRHLLLVLVSEHTLYHSLARSSYRIWTGGGGGRFAFRPADVGLGDEAVPLFAALAALFDALGRSPTPSAFARILDDLRHRVRTEEQLAQSVYGWMEGIEREALAAAALKPRLGAAMAELGRLLGYEELELRGD